MGSTNLKTSLDPKTSKRPKEQKTQTMPAASAAPIKKLATGGVIIGNVPANEPPKLDAADIASCQVVQEMSDVQAQVQKACDRIGLTSAHFWRVRGDYYEQDLAWRRDILGAASVQQLCKSMIMENTKLTEEEAKASGRIKYVMFVLQYANGKLNKEKMHDVIRSMEGSKAAAKKQYSIRMVSQEVSNKLSGFPHNAVTPFGMATPIPVLLSERIRALPEGRVWLGGGEVDLKLRLDVAELVAKFESPAGVAPIFADVTE
uniref:YbaK/aminoacyl-tRNA synthetase-associated domain-containing protein n=1 Tax=Haptolina brevifila TaxID=156173 RepID=A0A7S2DTW2_9EUKA